MFNKLSLLALVVPLVDALTLNIPQNPTSGGPCTITWTSAPGDPATFSLEFTNEAFHNTFAVANNVIPEQGSIDLTLPVMPVGSGYTLQAVNVGDVNDVFAETGQFAVGANGATSVSSLSQTSTRSSSSSNSASTRTSSSISTANPTITTRSSSTVFGTTVTTPSASTAASTSGQQAPTATTFNNSAPANFKLGGNMGTIAAALLSAVAGAAFVIL